MTASCPPLPNGFFAAGIHAGIGKHRQKKDLAIFYSAKKCNAAAVFTTNRVKAAPVTLSEKKLKTGKASAIVVNSGCANACTGSRGARDAQKICALAAMRFSLKPENILVASTGVIGEFLPMKKIEAGIEKLSSLDPSPLSAVLAMMTTDTFPKICSRQLRMKGNLITIWAAAKGAGMIHPKMATMLCFIFTDAGLPVSVMRKMLKAEVERSFNSLSVDGDTSTNDCVFFLANGLSEMVLETNSEQRKFQNKLSEVSQSLARQIASDGEGATKRIEIFVQGARTNADAKKIAETVATSPLVKTALFGKDANWGRIVAAVGRSGVALDPDKIEVRFDRLCVVRDGGPAAFSEKEAKRILNRKVVPITIHLHQGQGKWRYLTCDFSLEYVKINASYRS